MSFWRCNICKGELKTGKEKFLKVCNNCAREELKVFNECWDKKSLSPAFEKHGLKQKKETSKLLKNKKIKKTIINKLKKQGMDEKNIEKKLNKIK